MLTDRIALMGALNTGKTTLALTMAGKLRDDYPDKKIRVVTDVAASWPQQPDLSTLLDWQKWTMMRLMFEEYEAERAGIDILVTDTAVISPLVYAEAAGETRFATSMLLHVLVWMKKYTRIYFVRPKESIIRPGTFGRGGNESVLAIDRLFADYVFYHQIPVVDTNDNPMDEMLVRCGF